MSFASTWDAPVARIVSSTFCASMARSVSVTGRPWHALRTPETIFSRLNGSTTPLRFTTLRLAVSVVVNRRPHSGHCLRLRMESPSSLVRESMTRESGYRQKGQNIVSPEYASTGRKPGNSALREARCHRGTVGREVFGTGERNDLGRDGAKRIMVVVDHLLRPKEGAGAQPRP